MTTKTIWITVLDDGTGQVRAETASRLLRQYGIATQGSMFVDDPGKLAWRDGLNALNLSRVNLWLILANVDDLAKPSIRYGLSLFAESLREEKGAAFPIILSFPSVRTGEIPKALSGVTLVDESSARWAAKIVARTHVEKRAKEGEYFLSVIGAPQLGQWFSVGPCQSEWSGVIFGLCGGDDPVTIDFQAVGPRGVLPAKTVLEYEQRGLVLRAGDRQFSAWALRNRVSAGDAYFARVIGMPEAILFATFTEAGYSDATIVQLF